MRQKKSVFLLAAALLAATSATAVAQTVLSMHIEEETNWVRNFNPFNRTSYRQSTMDFIYEPLVVFGKLQGNKPYYRLATAMSLADDLKAVDLRPARERAVVGRQALHRRRRGVQLRADEEIPGAGLQQHLAR